MWTGEVRLAPCNTPEPEPASVALSILGGPSPVFVTDTVTSADVEGEPKFKTRRLNEASGTVIPMLAILLRPASVNHMRPSEPAAMPTGPEFCLGRGNCRTSPVGLILPTVFRSTLVNQTLPSGPTANPIVPFLAIPIRWTAPST